MNVQNFKRTLDYIKAHPNQWTQWKYGGSCGVEHCFIGWAAEFSEDINENEAVWRTAARWLGISPQEEEWICMSRNGIADFEAFLAEGGIPVGSEEKLVQESVSVLLVGEAA